VSAAAFRNELASLSAIPDNEGASASLQCPPKPTFSTRASTIRLYYALAGYFTLLDPKVSARYMRWQISLSVGGIQLPW